MPLTSPNEYEYEDEEDGPDGHYLIMWDENGLEAIIDVGPNEEVLNKFEGKPAPNYSRIFQMMKIRAQVNGHRHYEIYGLKTSSSIDKTELENLFEENPQMIVDLIREKGVKFYSNRATDENPKIR